MHTEGERDRVGEREALALVRKRVYLNMCFFVLI